MYFFIGRNSIKAQKTQTTILLNQNTIFEYKNKNWIKVNQNYINDYNWKEFDVFLDSEYKGKKLVWHDNQWYIFDKNKNAINYTEKFIGIKANYEINIKNFNVVTNNNADYTYEILSKYNLPQTAELTVDDKIITDIDNDGIDEEIYLVSNTFPLNTEPDTIFSNVFMVKNNQIYTMYENNIKGDIYSGCLPYINSIIDIDNDDNYEIILTCAKYSSQEPINVLYKFDKNKFIRLISSE